jgi:hypothetical protein
VSLKLRISITGQFIFNPKFFEQQIYLNNVVIPHPVNDIPSSLLPGTVIYDTYTHQLVNFEQIGEDLTAH